MRESKYLKKMIIDTDKTFKTNEMRKFADKVLNIQNYTMDDIIAAFYKIAISNDKDFEKFLKSFHDLCLKCPYPSAIACIAKFLCLELKPFEFREKISKLICEDSNKKIETYDERLDDLKNNVDIIILVAAEFYNYDIISCQAFVSVLEKLALNLKTTTRIFIFHLFLFTAALKLIHTGDGCDLQTVYHHFKNKPTKTMKRELFRRFKEFQDHFTTVFELSVATVKESQKKFNFSYIMDSLNEKNFDSSI
ncbi:unnamed protein product [Chironomus riparius]|uniref:Uncharacterized protein n=1 Tax=Chironomus riparius TaxID=315576 RepID=A0A9N9WV59_9DIPT|nr:unnamed protein product [Chironomus riparius]